MEQDRVVRQHLLSLLGEGNAHMTFDDAIVEFPYEYMNAKAPHVSYTPWHILEHLRIAQWDILEFIRDPAHESPEWPKGYWPEPDAEANASMWEKTVTAFRADLQALRDIVSDPRVNLYEPLPHGSGQTILREILLVADHNAYHIGEFAVLRQVMQTWPASHR